MKYISKILLVIALLFICYAPFQASAFEYPQYLYGNDQIQLAYAHWGYGTYVDKTSVVDELYSPPYYKAAANIITYDFDNNRVYDIETQYFSYNTDEGSIYIDNSGPYYNRPDSQPAAKQRPVEVAKIVWEATYHTEWN